MQLYRFLLSIDIHLLGYNQRLLRANCTCKQIPASQSGAFIEKVLYWLLLLLGAVLLLVHCSYNCFIFHCRFNYCCCLLLVYQDNRLHRNDQVLAVNGHSLLGCSNSKALDVLKSAMASEDTVTLMVARKASQATPSMASLGEEPEEVGVRKGRHD